MRVLVVSNLYPPHALGGYEMSCADVMRRFRQRGHDVHVLTTTTQLDVAVGGDDVVDVERTLEWYWSDHRLVQLGRVASWRLDRRNRRRLRRAIDDFRPDVVSFWAMGGMSLSLLEVAARADVPAVWVVCDEWPVYGPRIDRHAAFHGQRVPAPGEAAICWVSEFIRNQVLHATGWESRHGTVTGSGIDETDFPVQPARSRAWGWELLCVGRVEPRKGFATAVEALALLPGEARLRIAGPDDGSHGDELRRLADQLGVGDRLTIGAIPRSRLAEVYAGADAVLFTSAWNEPFGLVPLEAMACATPVVAVPTGGAAEFLMDESNCLAVAPGDASALAAATQRLATDERLRAALVAGGRATASRLTMQRLTDVLEQWHEAAAARFREGEPR